MAARSLARTRNELSDFLRRHRAKLTPADVGLPTTGGRRTPGLRREEMAQLAGVGITWYTWFEQGRDIQVSESFLLSVAKALRLDDAECTRLFLLAQSRPPRHEAHQLDTVAPRIQTLLDDLKTRPAYVQNLRWDVIAWNTSADQLFGFSQREKIERNMLRLVFADPDLRHKILTWQESALQLVSQFRCELAAIPDDPALLAQIDGLKKVSPDFRRLMEQPYMEKYSWGLKAMFDPDGKRVDFEHEMLIVDPYRHLRMVVYFDQNVALK